MNILLTEKCNKNCDFCLIPGRSESPKDMSVEHFQKCLQFADISHDRQLTLLGGEPTCHPHFNALMQLTAEQGFNVVLLSNFLFDSATLATIAGLSRTGVITEFLVNADFPSSYSDRQRARLIENLVAAPKYSINVTLAITLRDIRPIEDYRYLKDLCETRDLSRVRIALDVRTMPASIGEAQVGEHYYLVVRYLSECGIAVGAELCGVPRCIFTEYQHEYLRCHCAGYEFAGCEPNLDIFPDLTVSYCAARPAQGAFRRPLDDFVSLDHARAYFRGLRDLLHDGSGTNGSVANRCGSCDPLIRNQCHFGCLSVHDPSVGALPVSTQSEEILPFGIRIIPLLDHWHVWKPSSNSDGCAAFVVNDLGVQILRHAWQGCSVEEIVSQIVDEFDVGYDRAKADVLATLAQANATRQR